MNSSEATLSPSHSSPGRLLHTRKFSAAECTIIVLFCVFGITNLVLYLVYEYKSSQMDHRITALIANYNANVEVLKNYTVNCTDNSSTIYQDIMSMTRASKFMLNRTLRLPEVMEDLKMKINRINHTMGECINTGFTLTSACGGRVDRESFDATVANVTTRVANFEQYVKNTGLRTLMMPSIYLSFQLLSSTLTRTAVWTTIMQNVDVPLSSSRALNYTCKFSYVLQSNATAVLYLGLLSEYFPDNPLGGIQPILTITFTSASHATHSSHYFDSVVPSGLFELIGSNIQYKLTSASASATIVVYSMTCICFVS